MSARLACLVCALALAGTAFAQSSGGIFLLNPHATANGGGRSTGGVLALEGTIGQHDASNVQTGSVFELSGGLHRRGVLAPGDTIFSSGFEGP